MVKNILKRYEEAKVFIQHFSEEQFEEDLPKVRNKLDTLTRAYLESANDYMNPMPIEMHKTEKLLKKYDETGKS
ncbi:YeeD [Bacillus mojavensis]|uniref:YeeD n=1 Tax=Bacillus mojavensis TaxID=72360 RepID=A0ABX6LTR0_BACMO|nr:YeeD [Bacillus mojavensis]